MVLCILLFPIILLSTALNSHACALYICNMLLRIAAQCSVIDIHHILPLYLPNNGYPSLITCVSY